MAKVLIPILVIALGLTISYLINRNVTSRFDYRCAKCGETFSLSPLTAAVAPHRPVGRKWTRCPHCGARTWATPVPKSLQEDRR